MLRSVATIWLVCWGSVVFAAPKVAVFPAVPAQAGVPQTAATQLSADLATALGKRVELSSSAVSHPPEPMPALTREAKGLKRAQRDYKDTLKRLKKARKLLKRDRYRRAARHLGEAINGLLRNLERLEPYDELISAYVQMALVHFQLGEDEQGTDLLAAVATLRPDAQLPSRNFPPWFLLALEGQKRQVAALAPGSIMVRSVPAQISVAVDGRVLGDSPIRVDGLAPGIHHVVIKRGGFGLAQEVEVVAGEVAEVQLEMRHAVGAPNSTMVEAIAANRFDEHVRKAAKRAATANGDRFAVVSLLGSSNGALILTGFLGDLTTDQWMRLRSRELATDLSDAADAAARMADEIAYAIADVAGGLELVGTQGRGANAFVVDRRADDAAKAAQEAQDTTIPDITGGLSEDELGIDGLEDYAEPALTDLEAVQDEAPRTRIGDVEADGDSYDGPIRSSLLGLGELDNTDPAIAGGAIAGFGDAADLVETEEEAVSVFSTWWFWTAASAIAVTLGGGALYQEVTKPEEPLRVEAQW